MSKPNRSSRPSLLPQSATAALVALFLTSGGLQAAPSEGGSPATAGGKGGKSADEIAKELSNPAGSLASLNFNLQYQTFKGDLPGADDQGAGR